MPPRKFILPRSNDGDALPSTTKKPLAGKQRPEGISNMTWAAAIARWAAVNQDQRKREAAARLKKAAAATAAAYGPPHCPGVFRTQGSVSSPTSLSPSSLATFQEGHVYTPLSRFSPSPSSGEYPDGDPHGGFNPNSFFEPPDPHHGGLNADLNVFPPDGINLNGSSLAHRRVPVHHADQGRLSPSSSAYFGAAGQEVKIDLLKTNVAAIKRKEDLALLTADTSSMCTEVKAWHKAQCDIILAEMRPPPASSTTMLAAAEPPEAPNGASPTSVVDVEVDEVFHI
jgi:hypothetical protein